jgi:hypothetical protein
MWIRIRNTACKRNNELTQWAFYFNPLLRESNQTLNIVLFSGDCAGAGHTGILPGRAGLPAGGGAASSQLHLRGGSPAGTPATATLPGGASLH